MEENIAIVAGKMPGVHVDGLLATVQGKGQALQFFKFWVTQTKSGKLLHIVAAWLQLHAGVCFSLHVDVHSSVPHMATRWLPSLHILPKKINGTIQLDLEYVSPIQRIHNKYMMGTMIQSAAFARWPRSRFSIIAD